MAYTTKKGIARNGEVQITYELTQPAETYQNQPGLLFVGGWGEGGRTWGREVAYFAHRYPTLSYDRRGLGNSSRPNYQEAYTVEQEIADLNALLEATGLAGQKIRPICHSYGCHLIVHWLMDESKAAQVDKLVLTTPTARAVLDAESPYGALDAAELKYMNESLLNGDNQHLKDYSRKAIPEGGEATEPLRRAIANLVPSVMSPQVALWGFNHYYYLDLRPLLPKLEMPVLLVSGEVDSTMKWQAGAEVARLIKNSRHLVIPQVGHLLHLTVADQLSQLIEQFFTEA